jgi:hypothetical protein
LEVKARERNIKEKERQADQNEKTNTDGICPREWTLSTSKRAKTPVFVYQCVAAGTRELEFLPEY